jgi:hypothetical protein
MTMEIRSFLEEHLSRPEAGWSIGVFGALAEFRRAADEPARCSGLTVSTSLGAIRLDPVEACRPVAYEPRSARQHDRKLGIALCLPESSARLERRAALTELGKDKEAIDAKDRDAVLFDLGLDSPYASFCIRTGDPALIDKLRKGAGRTIVEAENPLFNELAAASPHRVLISRLGRIEVYQPIAKAGGTTPEGPHTHLLPKLVKSGRTHSANALLPEGLVPCATFYPE